MQEAEAAALWDLRAVPFRALDVDQKAHTDTLYEFIAEEVAKIDPQLVTWTEDAEGQRRVEGVDYDRVVPLLLHQTKAFKHEAPLKALEGKHEAAQGPREGEFHFAALDGPTFPCVCGQHGNPYVTDSLLS